MRGLYQSAMAACALGLVAGCGSHDAGNDATPATSPAATASPAGAIAVALPPADFTPCAACHAGVAGINGVGPSLFGVFGRKAASLPGYDYSPQLKAAGLTWDDATLDKWLTSPAAMVPGTKMTFPGYPEAAKRQAVIAYLTTLK